MLYLDFNTAQQTFFSKSPTITGPTIKLSIQIYSRKIEINDLDNEYFVAAHSYKYYNDIDKTFVVVLKLCLHYQLYILSQQYK